MGIEPFNLCRCPIRLKGSLRMNVNSHGIANIRIVKVCANQAILVISIHRKVAILAVYKGIAVIVSLQDRVRMVIARAIS